MGEWQSGERQAETWGGGGLRSPPQGGPTSGCASCEGALLWAARAVVPSTHVARIPHQPGVHPAITAKCLCKGTSGRRCRGRCCSPDTALRLQDRGPHNPQVNTGRGLRGLEQLAQGPSTALPGPTQAPVPHTLPCRPKVAPPPLAPTGCPWSPPTGTAGLRPQGMQGTWAAHTHPPCSCQTRTGSGPRPPEGRSAHTGSHPGNGLHASR